MVKGEEQEKEGSFPFQNSSQEWDSSKSREKKENEEKRKRERKKKEERERGREVISILTVWFLLSKNWLCTKNTAVSQVTEMTARGKRKKYEEKERKE